MHDTSERIKSQSRPDALYVCNIKTAIDSLFNRTQMKRITTKMNFGTKEVKKWLEIKFQ